MRYVELRFMSSILFSYMEGLRAGRVSGSSA
jgi:hypothetical protein